MKRHDLTTNFHVDEYVAPELYHRFGLSSRYFLDVAMVEGVQLIRNALDTPIIVNDWATGGVFRYSGLRPFDCHIGEEYSRHKFGACADIKMGAEDLASVWGFLRDNADRFGITELETPALTIPKKYIHLGFGGPGPFRIIGG